MSWLVGADPLSRRNKHDDKDWTILVHFTNIKVLLYQMFWASCGPIPINFACLLHLTTYIIIKISNLCNNIFRFFRSTGGQNPRFPVDFAGNSYNSAALYRAACDKQLAIGIPIRFAIRYDTIEEFNVDSKADSCIGKLT